MHAYNYEQGINYDEFFAPVARMEASRILIALSIYKEFKLFQMNVKNVFLNRCQKEEVFVKQPPSFVDVDPPNRVLKLCKVLYGMKQAPRVWYKRLTKFLLENGFKRGKIDNLSFLKSRGRELLIIQVYIDEIIFRATSESLCKDSASLMGNELKIRMIGELAYFLGLQIKQPTRGTSICQETNIKKLLKKFNMMEAKEIDTPYEQVPNLIKMRHISK